MPVRDGRSNQLGQIFCRHNSMIVQPNQGFSFCGILGAVDLHADIYPRVRRSRLYACVFTVQNSTPPARGKCCTQPSLSSLQHRSGYPTFVSEALAPRTRIPVNGGGLASSPRHSKTTQSDERHGDPPTLVPERLITWFATDQPKRLLGLEAPLVLQHAVAHQNNHPCALVPALIVRACEWGQPIL
jgi:hypothetical protein